MKNSHWKIYITSIIVLLLGSCVDDYLPPEIATPNSFLVVDGYLNTGQGVSSIYLSRTQNIAESGYPQGELHAQVSFESEQGTTYPLTGKGEGLYTLADYTVDQNQKYRLKITTESGKEYLSDFVSIKQTPQIDSISWKIESKGIENTGVQIYVNTHDDQNNTWFYRWTYEETWQFTSAFESKFDFINWQLVPRTEDIYNCWRTEPSTNISIGSSVKLSQDMIRDFPLTFLPGTSDKLGIRYSILVRQYAISEEAYSYYELLRKNTESLGTLFDPQPSQLTGNIRCINAPDEVVIGYFDAAVETSKRIFIDKSQLSELNTITGYEACRADTVDIERPPRPDESPRIPTGYMFIERRMYIKVFDEMGNLVNRPTIGGVISPASCVDCRLKGTNIKPDFW